MKKILPVIIAILFISINAFGAIYYMRADGTAANKAAASGPCSTQANCMSMAIHTGETFSAGDIVKLCDNGGDYTAVLTPPSSGSDGNPITYIAETGDTPVIDVSVDYSSWTGEGETVILDKEAVTGGAKIWHVATIIWAGQGVWTSDGNYTVSSFEVKFNFEWGTFSQNVVAEIYTMNGAALGNLVDTSNAQLVDAIGTYKFIGMNASLSNGVDYALVIRREDSGWDADNCMSPYVDTTGDTWSGAYCVYQADKTRMGIYAGWEMGVKLYQAGVSPYYATYVSAPNQMFWDDTLMTKEAVKGNLGTGEWYDDGVDKIYVYDNPSGHTVEGSYWARCIFTNNKSYLTFDGLTLLKSNGHNFWLDTGSGRFDDIIIRNCTVKQAYNAGLGIGAGGFSDTGQGVSTGLQILNNTLTDNGHAAAADGSTGFACNIAGNSPTDYIEDVLVSGNIATDNNGHFKADWFGNDIVFEYNYADGDGTAFSCDGCQYVTWEKNIIDGAGTSNNYAFSIFRWEGAPGPPFGFALTDNKIINNTIYNKKKGISLADDQTNTIVKNNIYYGNFADNVPVWMDGGETRTGLDIDYNLYYTGANTPVFTISGVNTYNFAEWQALSNDTNSPAMADSLFTNAGGDDFTLKPGSPCRHGGDPSLTSYTTKLRPEASWPSGVTTMEDILSIGAYGVYRGSAGM